ncbi:MAG: DUF6075 family protein, partial [Oscillospiraceae bacterium]
GLRPRRTGRSFVDMMGEAGGTTATTGPFSIVMGIAPETAGQHPPGCLISSQDRIEPEGMHGGWQTSGTVRVCRLAFNLWNGYTDPEHSNAYSPEDLFCCEFAPYFMEGVEIRYPEYCRELPPARKQAGAQRGNTALNRRNRTMAELGSMPCRATPQIIELLSVLEQNSLSKAEGRSTGPGAGYIDGMEGKLAADDGRK